MKKTLIFLSFFLLSAGFIRTNSTVSDEKMPGKTKSKTYTVEELRTIAFPVGGLGTGNITIGGRGEIREMEIFNRPAKGVPPDLTFFSIWAKTGEKKSVAKILERKLIPPYVAWMGIPRLQLPGVARFDEAVFEGEFPFARLKFMDKDIPLKVSLEAYNPFIPLDPLRSGIPGAVFNWILKNENNHPIKASLCFSMQNPIKTRNKEGRLQYGKNLNQYIEEDSFRGIRMTSNRADRDSLEYGDIAISTPCRNALVQTRWYRGGWWDNAHVFWDDFSDDGIVEGVKDALESPDGRSDVCSLLIQAELKPGEEQVIPFYLTWYVPNRENYWNREEEVKGKKFRNYYAARFQNVLDVTRYIIGNISGLYEDTKTFHDILFSSTYPFYVIDALSSQASSLKTNLLLRTEDGKSFGFEGLTDDSGCCPMNCTHVWNYENTMAFLFPSLERSFRETDFLHNTFVNGYQVFRTLMPLGPYWWKFKPCADGQMGNIVRVYREWKLSGDTDWLKKLWPKVKKALEFAWKGVGEVDEQYEWQQNMLKMAWDPDKNGVMEAEQHNTYDIEYYGPNTMTGSLYLAALKASAEMAEYLGEKKEAREYLNLFEQGSKIYENTLWNGDYYIQKVHVLDGLTVPEHLKSPEKVCTGPECKGKKSPGGKTPALEKGDSVPKYQYGSGCLSDQLLGQYLAFVTGLDYVLTPSHVDKALASIYDYNFREDLSGFSNVQRVYALNGEAGLLLCSWPQGNRPALPFVYSDEVWTGIEYQVAASLIYAGHLEKGLKIVQAVRDRYRGYNRNPWDELECGHHYARAMASWALLLALSGFHYDGVNNTMSFSPKINRENFMTFWSTGSAWGRCTLNNSGATLDVKYGSLKLKEISFSSSCPWESLKSCLVDSQSIKCEYESDAKKHSVLFSQPVEMKKGQHMKLGISR
ncbi:MAG: hypothetical protein JXB26_20275 [Candidatus Aminicenantes bacterium]|nr:hypothetical protein [Candidatus Aminicenantes bacterium]